MMKVNHEPRFSVLDFVFGTESLGLRFLIPRITSDGLQEPKTRTCTMIELSIEHCREG